MNLGIMMKFSSALLPRGMGHEIVGSRNSACVVVVSNVIASPY